MIRASQRQPNRWVAGAYFSLMLLGGCATRPADNDPFPMLEDWSKRGKPALFSPDTLYQHIDGAAESYLAYEFQQLAVQSYENARKKTLTVEIYRHRSPLDAFGIYSSEKPLQGDYLAVGAEGYQEEGTLNFFHGDCYVKIGGFGLDPTEQKAFPEAAAKVAERLGAGAGLPAELRLFPEPGRIAHSERLIKASFLGHSFLHSALVADYQIAGKKFQLFVILGKDQADAHEMLTRWVELCTRKVPAKLLESYTLTDPYNGRLRVESRGGGWLWGAVPDPGAEGETAVKSLREAAIHWKTDSAVPPAP